MGSAYTQAGIAALLVLLALGSGPVAADERAAPEESVRPVLTMQLGHADSLMCAVPSPDGTCILTGSGDNTACLWETATGRELRRFQGHRGQVSCAAFSPDGSQVLTGSSDGTARLWETATGRQIRRFPHGERSGVDAVAFSSNGARIVTGSYHTVHVWETAKGVEVRRILLDDLQSNVSSVAFSPDGTWILAEAYAAVLLLETATGREIRRLQVDGTDSMFTCAALSPDGRYVATGSYDDTARLWETATGREVHRMQHAETVGAVAFSSDGTLIATRCPRGVLSDDTVFLWEAATGREIRRFPDPGENVEAIAFLFGDTHVLTNSWWGARLWDRATGREVRRLEGRASTATTVAYAPDGAHLLVVASGASSTARLWETATGRETRRIAVPGARVASAAFSPDGAHVLTGSDDFTARLWEIATGKEVRRYEGHRESVTSVAFSPNSRFVLTACCDGSACLWNRATGGAVRWFGGRGDGGFRSVVTASFSPDGAYALVLPRYVLAPAGPGTSTMGTAHLWSTASGLGLRRFACDGAGTTSAAVTLDGARVLTGCWDGSAHLWDLATGEHLRGFAGHGRDAGGANVNAPFLTPEGASVLAVALSPEGGHLLTGSVDATARLWDIATGREVRRFAGHHGRVNSVAFSPDGSRVLTGSSDGTVRLWDTATATELCRLVSFRDGTWAVIDSDGRFDASRGGDVEGLHWVVGMETISLSQLKRRYYDPGLLAKHLGWSAEPLRKVAAFDTVKLFPRVEIEPPGPDNPCLGIHLRNRGGGIGRVVVRVNDKEVEADARRDSVPPDAEEARLEIDLADDPRVKPGEVNTVQVLAYNAEGYLSSRGPQIGWQAPGTRVRRLPHLWAIVCGVSNYRTDAIDLRFAAKDAEDFAEALRLAGEGLLDDRVHLQVLSTSTAPGAVQPTRANLEKAFAAARQAGPDDILVVYLSGHGVNFGGQDGDYHYLVADASSADLTDPAVRKETSVSSAELTDWLNQIPASKRLVLILDTCASGQLITDLTEARDVPSSQKRALDRLKDRTGTWVLAGCASNRVSYEATRYAQGLLTYSLLLGMRGGALREGRYVDVQKLLGFAVDEVPRLARDVGGVQRPVVAQPKEGASFDIGELSPAARGRIPIQRVKPVFQRSAFFDDRQWRDSIGLGPAVDEVLRTYAARGRGAPVVHVDASGVVGAYQITGKYTIEADAIKAQVALWSGDVRVAGFQATGHTADVGALAAALVKAAQAKAEAHHRNRRQN